jgi:hypothetical protein
MLRLERLEAACDRMCDTLTVTRIALEKQQGDVRVLGAKLGAIVAGVAVSAEIVRSLFGGG